MTNTLVGKRTPKNNVCAGINQKGMQTRIPLVRAILITFLKKNGGPYHLFTFSDLGEGGGVSSLLGA